MEIKVVKLDARRSQSLLTRDDRVTLRVTGYGPSQPMPHDLAHYVVEKELALRRGFWGSVADGALFPGTTVIAGRQRPHARERSDSLCKANSRNVTEVEVIVGLMVELMRNNVPATSRYAAKAATDRLAPRKDSELRAISAADLQRLNDGLSVMARRWSDVKVGDALVVQW
jgi:hypothetical protein